MKTKIRIQALPVLLALLLVSVVAVPGVNANSENRTISGGIDREIQAIFDNASELEALPQSLGPRAEQEYMENYVSPAEMAIEMMKAKGYSESQITGVLTKNGYGWYPATGACWKGRAPTPEEQKVIDQIRGPAYTSFPESAQGNTGLFDELTGGLIQRDAVRNQENGNTCFGISLLYMSPGEIACQRQTLVFQMIRCMKAII